jgi:hypothetical protein
MGGSNWSTPQGTPPHWWPQKRAPPSTPSGLIEFHRRERCHTSWGISNEGETGEFCWNLPGGGYRTGMTPTPTPPTPWTAEIVPAGERHAAADRGARVRVSQPSTPQGTPLIGDGTRVGT